MRPSNYLHLKKISFLIFVLPFLCTGTLPAQDKYVKDHVIVYFRDNVLNKNLLTSDSRSFNRTDLVTEKALTDSLDKWRIGRTFQKVVKMHDLISWFQPRAQERW